MDELQHKSTDIQLLGVLVHSGIWDCEGEWSAEGIWSRVAGGA